MSTRTRNRITLSVENIFASTAVNLSDYTVFLWTSATSNGSHRPAVNAQSLDVGFWTRAET